ncbi:ankyrin repeat-containing domain protein [Astrocystis sublimbata]|nr:ankyrin repeat-containing domain protein [Astrocystis sublimbata]
MTSPPEPPSHEPQLQDLGEMDEHRAFLISAGVCTSCADDYNAFVSKAKAAAHKPKPPSPYFFIMLEKETSANDAKEYASFMPLHWAATVGQIEIVRLLLGANAAVDSKTSSSGRTPLHLAAHNGHHEIVRLLLDANADMDLDTSYGKNFLHSAVDGFDSVYEAQYSAKLDDHFLVVRLLVDTKASTSTDSPDPHISTIFKALSLKGVSEQNRIRILDCLIEKVVDKGKVLNVLYEDDFIFPKEESPLYHAIRKDSLDAARYLVDKGADPLLECAASLSDLHQLPIHLAIRKDGRNTLELVRQMVNKEPKLIDTLTSRGESCLYLSVCKGDVECTEYLLSQSAAWPPQDHDGSLSAWAKRSPSLKSPWQFAYSKRDWRIIGAFLKKERMVLHYRAHKSVVVKGIRHLTRESRIHRLGADELDGYNVSRAHKKDCAVTWFLPGGDELRWGGNVSRAI